MDEQALYRKQQKVSTFQLTAEVIILLALTVSAFVTNSLIAWMDFAESIFSILRALMIFVISKKLKHDLRFEFNYGSEKIKGIAMLTGNVFFIVSLLMIIYSSIKSLASPMEVSPWTWIMIPIMGGNLVIDIICISCEKRLLVFTKDRLVRDELNSSIQSFTFDIVSFITVLATYTFRANPVSHYITPLVCLIIGVAWVVISLGDARSAVYEIMDRTLDEETQMKILKVLNNNFMRYEDFYEVKSHKTGEECFIDIDVSFSDETTFDEIRRFSNDIQEQLSEIVPECRVTIIVPGSRTDDEGVLL